MARRDVKLSSKKRKADSKALEIRQTSPPGKREDHEKYSAEVSAAIRKLLKRKLFQ